MTAVRYRNTLTPDEEFVIADDTCGHGALVSSGTYTFIDWESSDLIALVKQGGMTFTLGLEPGLMGVDKSVSTSAAFVCTPEEFKVFQRQQTECGCQ